MVMMMTCPAPQAYELQQAGKQYIVKDDKIVLVDENTGRLKAITRYQDGMHQVRARGEI